MSEPSEVLAARRLRPAGAEPRLNRPVRERSSKATARLVVVPGPGLLDPKGR
ncbi:hypothetical protein ABZ128_29860 [Streptomyces sp. NPDC006326]|uniref:hypothetical protein n=1 Tax=Streptomyces sp. NPDC006326 TaxID=3156752 RepID=UPI0033BBC9C7